jgi:stress-induced-phosphoprotein 1
MTSAWGLDVPEEVIKTEALDRLDRLGWDSVRPGLAVTIRSISLLFCMSSALIVLTGCRASIINAQMSAGFNQFGQAACLLWRALNLLDWGRERWSKVDRKQRGAIFDVSWIRSVRVLYGGMLVSVSLSSVSFLATTNTDPPLLRR